MSEKKNLVKIIKDNPGCVAVIDDDHWTLYREQPDNNPHSGDYRDESWGKCFEWEKANTLARDGEVLSLGDGGYGSGNCYGGDLLQALALIVGVKVVSV